MTDQELAERATTSSIPWVCIHCGEEWPSDTREEFLQEHLWLCEKHPLGQASRLLNRWVSVGGIPLHQDSILEDTITFLTKNGVLDD